ncbi:hypothetical protein LIER_30909 [Lithospermum erythrorhizon]|uniref:Protein IQ-DOMAIN 1 n=1 Tax=Lithospermum erythrorhizon TaxID=34254 RepID=A0AAV3RP85_LITER
MGNGDWFKNIISLKKAKDDKPRKSKASTCNKKNGDTLVRHSEKVSSKAATGSSHKNHLINEMPIEDVAATQIQTAYRAYKARKAFRCLRGIERLQTLTQGHSVKKQASMTLSYLHSWNRIQAEIKARRVGMVIEGRLKQKKLENQLKLDAKLHDLEVEWSPSSETMEEVLAKIHLREAAAVKRERTLAYAFSHQWRPNSNSGLGNTDISKANWGWSWMDRWIAARPWERRVPVQPSPKKGHSPQSSKTGKNSNTPTTKSFVKTISPNGKGVSKPRKLTYDEAPEKVHPQKGPGKAEATNGNKAIMVS